MKRLSTAEFIYKSKLIHGDKYSYDNTKYITNKINVEIICPIHESWFTKPAIHLKGSNCPRCVKDSEKLNIVDFINRSNIIHNFKYDYSKVNYINSNTKIEITCKDHGGWFITPTNHLSGNGCLKCGYETVSNKLSSNLLDFVDKANEIHNHRYDYSKVKYINSKTKIEIICIVHGSWRAAAGSHLSGHGCPKCRNDKFYNKYSKKIDEFIKEANVIHNHKYNYDKSIYINTHSKLEINCPKHGSFWQEPACHLSQKQGCPKCGEGRNISNAETNWLNYLNIPDEFRNTTIKVGNKKFKVDAFDPNINTIYEFYGDYWHGNPKIFRPNDINKRNGKNFGELYRLTLEKEKVLSENGYKIMSIWENDWESLQ